MGYVATNMAYAHDEAIDRFHLASLGQPTDPPAGNLPEQHQHGVAKGTGTQSGACLTASLIGDEVRWRRPPAASAAASLRIAPTRWCSSDNHLREASAETTGDGYVVKLVLRPMNIRLSVSGRVVQDGVASAGMLHVSEPSAPAHCLFRGPYDALHLHVPNDLLIEHGGRQSAAILHSKPTPERDQTILQLGLALLKAEDFGPSLGQIYADGLSLAIVTRLLALQSKDRGRTKAARLSNWRLKRAIDYIDVHLGDALSLADVAAAAGLSRMHFASQFKSATGLRPHDFVLRRRISRAQELMATPAASLVDIALQVGFQSQAHFTTVFKRLVGQPPHAWRKSRNPSP